MWFEDRKQNNRNTQLATRIAKQLYPENQLELLILPIN